MIDLRLRDSDVLTVGKLLTEELRARGWSQVTFAAIIGRPQQFVSEVVHGKKALTARSAAQFGAALGTSADLWLNIQARRELAELGHDESFQRQLDKIRQRGQDGP